MKFRRIVLPALFTTFLFLSVVLLCAFADAEAGEVSGAWDAAGDVARIGKQIPSGEAFSDAERVVWLDAYHYRLRADGTSEKRRRSLFIVRSGVKEPDEHRISLPSSSADTFSVTEAAYYDPSTAKRVGLLQTERVENAGLGYVRVILPPEVVGRVVAVESVAVTTEKYRMGDALPLAGEYPIWEGDVTVEIPDGMALYWQGERIGSPARSTAGSVGRFVWSVSNQPAWRGSRLVEEKRPVLLFSLHKGATESLKDLFESTRAFALPRPPAGLAKTKGDLFRAGALIAGYMKDKGAGVLDGTPGIRTEPPESGPWTAWERTLIAGRWLEGLGFDVGTHWRAKTDVGSDSPGTPSLWLEPVLLIRDRSGQGASSTKEIAYKSDQSVAFGRQPASLYGAVLYRANGHAFERITLPKGTASENELDQSWRLAIGPDGVASGTLGFSLSGAWIDVLFPNGEPSPESASAKLKSAFLFGIPGLEMTPKAVKKVGTGYRMNFDVKASLGIVSGGNMLTRLPCAIPRELEDVPVEGSPYSFRFPFSIQQSLFLGVPRGYRVVGPPRAREMGGSKASIMENLEYRASKGRLEASCRWVIRADKVDELLAGEIREQLALFLEWSKIAVPFRKK